MIQVDSLVVSLFQSNCFILRQPDSRDAIVIDPGDDAAAIQERLAEQDLVVKAYLLTHGHVDHLFALADMVAVRPAPVALHPADAIWAFTERAAFPPYYGVPKAPPAINRNLADDQVWTDIGLTYRVIHLPGHSPGGVGFYFEAEKTLFSGDTLFRGSVGRSDLPGSEPAALEQSLLKLLTLPDDTTVYCGHGPATTLGRERRQNPYLQAFG